MKKEKRFRIINSQSSFGSSLQIIVDTKTGVQYIYHSAGYGGGMTLLVDREGKPMLYSRSQYEE